MAAAISPSFTTRAGPFGPSGVKTMFFPARASRMISRRAFAPPRVDDPRTDPTPYQSNTRAMYSPSFDCEIIAFWHCHLILMLHTKWHGPSSVMISQ